jgi:hypothetical protein
MPVFKTAGSFLLLDSDALLAELDGKEVTAASAGQPAARSSTTRATGSVPTGDPRGPRCKTSGVTGSSGR